MLKKLKLSAHLLLFLAFVELVALIMGSLSLRVSYRLEHRLNHLEIQDFPLILAVSEAARQQMDQTLRMNEVLLYADMNDRQNFEVANEGYIHAGKRLTNVLIEARHISQKGLENPESDVERNQLERIKSALGDLEKIHGSYEHLGGSIIRTQFQYRFLTRAGIITGNATQSLEEAEKEYLQNLGKHISDLDDETKRLEGKLKEAFYVTKDLLRDLAANASKEYKIAWTVFILSMVVFTIGGFFLIAAVYRIHDARSHELLNAIRKMAVPFREKSDSLLKTAQRLDNSLSNLSANSGQLAATVQHDEAALTTLSELTVKTIRITSESTELVSISERKVTDTEQSLQTFEGVLARSLAWGEKIYKGMMQLEQAMMQMNLLATSASVEASRAESKHGFSVFTNELKNLTKQSKQGIEGISELTETTLKDLKSGSDGVERARKRFQEIADAIIRLQSGAETVRNTSQHQSELVGTLQSNTVKIQELFFAYTHLLEDSAGACRMFRSQTESIAELLKEMLALMDDQQQSAESKRTQVASPLSNPGYPPRQPFEGGNLKVEGGVLKEEKEPPAGR